MQAVAGLSAALGIAFYSTWQLTLVIMGCVPFVFLTGFYQSRHIRGRSAINKRLLEGAGKVNVYAHAHTHTNTHKFTHVNTYVCMYMCVNTCVCACVCDNVCVCVTMCVCDSVCVFLVCHVDGITSYREYTHTTFARNRNKL